MKDEHDSDKQPAFFCPAPLNATAMVMLSHGGGGSMSRDFIADRILPVFRNELLEPLHDGAVFEAAQGRFAFTTDSFVMDPLFIPGADIGSVEVNGTVNDLCMCGATPLFISVAFILEEGFPLDLFSQVLLSMKRAADAAGVLVITGDTKVVEHGKADKVFITTAGIGRVGDGVSITAGNARPGDVVLINGPIAEHGIAVVSRREGLEFASSMTSDCTPLTTLVRDILDTGKAIHVLRDPTRGGVASALNEIAAASGVGIRIDERAIPISGPVQAACELLGFDPLYVANEGKCLAFVAPEHEEEVLLAMRNNPLGRNAVRIGVVVESHRGRVTMRTRIGGTRFVDMISGEQLPRIC